MSKQLVALCALVAGLGSFGLEARAAGDDKGFVPLFDGKSLAGWKTFLKDQSADASKTFVIKDGEVQVSGQPFGYFYTEKPYKNYVLRYTWTYPKDQPDKTTMNSGCLIHIQGPNKIWPRSVEPQCRYMDHGKLFFIGFDKEAKKEQKFDEAAQKRALKPSHEWNTTEVIARGDGAIEVRINGVLVTTGRSELTEGPIGFQSEGARIHFKDIVIKSLGEGKTSKAEPGKGQAEEIAPPKKVIAAKGTLVIEADDPDVAVVVKQNGVLQKNINRPKEYKVKTGEYTIELEAKGFKLSTNRFTIERDGKVVVRIAREAKPATEEKKVAQEKKTPPAGKTEAKTGQPAPDQPQPEVIEYRPRGLFPNLRMRLQRFRR
jgi:hypothetical protein